MNHITRLLHLLENLRGFKLLALCMLLGISLPLGTMHANPSLEQVTIVAMIYGFLAVVLFAALLRLGCRPIRPDHAELNRQVYEHLVKCQSKWSRANQRLLRGLMADPEFRFLGYQVVIGQYVLRQKPP